MTTLEIIVVSDTHGRHDELGELAGDVLVHCGDGCTVSNQGSADHDSLDAWFARQRFNLILAIGGNCDYEFARRARARVPVFRHARVLQDETVEHGGLRFHGAPWTPFLSGMPFYGDDVRLRRAWRAVPEGVDVLITHTAAAGILDHNRHGHSLGCGHLLDELPRIRPRLHLFGHHHAAAGTTTRDGTVHLNASMVDSRYRIARPPWRVRVDQDPHIAPEILAT